MSHTSNFQPVLSIITIVYNNVTDIERTIRSIVAQDYPHIEYIVVDGASTDGTLEIIYNYQKHIAKVLSEKDEGIYDAMNKGLRLADGDYILFMNSGDELYAPNTVSSVFQTASDADIYYGETEMIDEKGVSLGRRRHKAPEKFTWKSFKYGMSISHQAIYIKKTICGFYDTRYQLSADIDWILTAAKKADHIVNTHRYVAKYLVGGMSKKRHFKSLKERFHILTKHYGLMSNLLNHLVITFNLACYYSKHGKTND
ncbi:glycosyltransferase [Olivibacter sp. SDN3]|uniref:glycosyltransferase family 2 protein n=1 Tax=Olivibacter sp. SDN3 TaxID=2764720 RepID=UPI001650DBE5|nr:glycosyltransferase family 2 protein [Olivibacter sp. SDN3]QNL51414.1 glycosyltransferase [Olivibacter sp. SDN3]